MASMIHVHLIGNDTYEVQPVAGDVQLPVRRFCAVSLPTSILVALVTLNLSGTGIRVPQFGIMRSDTEWELEDACLTVRQSCNAA